MINITLVRMLIKDMFELQPSKEPIKIYADGKESYFQKEIIPIKAVPTGEKNEKHLGDVIFLKNITIYKELDFAKTNFIATVSHELKTPISSINMSTQLLENDRVGKLNPEQNDLVRSIRNDAMRLLKITSELLNMSQLESGKIQLKKTNTSPLQLIEVAVNNNRVAANNKHIQIIKNIQDRLPEINVDTDKTIWVLNNLISNAIRYSYEYSSITVEISADEKFVKISIADTGQGIAPQYINKIFDRYFRIPGSKKEGTGLGLAISKELLEQQGGKIELESEFGAGSIFTVTIPSL